MKYRKSFLREVERFEGCADQPGTVARAPRSEIGLRQFYDWESSGVKPVDPDPYFVRLCDGKAWWEWTLNTYAESYLKPYLWAGWYAYALDFKDDPAGFRQLRLRCGCEPIDPVLFIQQCDENAWPGVPYEFVSSL